MFGAMSLPTLLALLLVAQLASGAGLNGFPAALAAKDSHAHAGQSAEPRSGASHSESVNPIQLVLDKRMQRSMLTGRRVLAADTPPSPRPPLRPRAPPRPPRPPRPPARPLRPRPPPRPPRPPRPPAVPWPPAPPSPPPSPSPPPPPLPPPPSPPQPGPPRPPPRLVTQGTPVLLGTSAPPRPPPPAEVLLSLDTMLPGSKCPDAVTVVQASNTYRSWHQAGDLTWDATLAAASQAYADVLAPQQCALVHGGVAGENLYRMTSYPKPDGNCVRAIDMFYTEVARYNWTSTPFTSNKNNGIGHFAQMVWRASKTFGCGVGLGTVPWPSMPGGVVGCKIVVCRYSSGALASDALWLANVIPRV